MAFSVVPLTLFSPAKINLFLAITGRRPDGFHNLVSVVAPLAFGDRLTLTSGTQGTTLSCDVADIPLDASNLVLRAAEAFRARTGWSVPVHFHLEKRIPVGAGLGGGSSNAVTALLALNQWSGLALPLPDLEAIAATLGSDCPLFLKAKPVVMRGRGERVDVLNSEASARLSGRKLLVFKPSIGISTPWAYRRMVERGGDYLPEAQAEARLSTWISSAAPAEDLLYNSMEAAAFEKFLALPTLLEQLHTRFGLRPRMSGSGSACFALLADSFDEAPVIQCVREAWGATCFTEVSKIP